MVNDLASRTESAGRRTIDTNDKVELTTAATARDMQASA
jgi:hypothetical protein